MQKHPKRTGLSPLVNMHCLFLHPPFFQISSLIKQGLPRCFFQCYPNPTTFAFYELVKSVTFTLSASGKWKAMFTLLLAWYLSTALHFQIKLYPPAFMLVKGTWSERTRVQTPPWPKRTWLGQNVPGCTSKRTRPNIAYRIACLFIAKSSWILS